MLPSRASKKAWGECGGCCVAERRRNPTVGRRYLDEADYFRIGYQLSAQLLNAEGQSEEVAVVLEAPLSHQGAAAAVPASTGARTVAEELSCEAGEVLAWYALRQSRPWAFWRRLSKKEKRLQAFLSRTVKPCLELVRAASARCEGGGHVDIYVDPLREDAAAGRLSYRALYNLACFEAGAGENRRQQTLNYLQEALREAPADRVEELSAWGERDPALKGVKEEDGFAKLIEQSQPMEVGAPNWARGKTGEVFRLVRENPGISVRELAQALSISERSAGILRRMAMPQGSAEESVEK